MKRQLAALLLTATCAFGLTGFTACELLDSLKKDSSTEPKEVLEYTLNEDGASYTVSATGYSEEEVNITIPTAYNGKTVTTVGSFYSLYGRLKSITIPDSVTTIESGAFSGCRNLANVIMSQNVTSIKFRTFSDCASLTEITIPDSVTSIGESAFEGCSNLTSITIGKGITSIGSDAFKKCSNLADVHITDIAAWCAIDFRTNPLEPAENLYLNDTLITELIIPDHVTSITERAFSGCDSLTGIVLPNNMTTIKSYTFSNCDGLTEVTIPKNITAIDGSAFSGCDNLTNISFEVKKGWKIKGGTGDFSSIISNPEKTADYLTGNGKYYSSLVSQNAWIRVG